MLVNAWNKILDWFDDRSERSRLMRNFNDSAKRAFISGNAPTLLKASISKGDRGYRHQFSNWLKTGFRIQAFSGRELGRKEIEFIGAVILSDDTLVRKMVVLGWDTLEIHGDKGCFGLKWQLKNHVVQHIKGE